MKIGRDGLYVVVYVVLHEVLRFLIFLVSNWVYCGSSRHLPFTRDVTTLKAPSHFSKLSMGDNQGMTRL